MDRAQHGAHSMPRPASVNIDNALVLRRRESAHLVGRGREPVDVDAHALEHLRGLQPGSAQALLLLAELFRQLLLLHSGEQMSAARLTCPTQRVCHSDEGRNRTLSSM